MHAAWLFSFPVSQGAGSPGIRSGPLKRLGHLPRPCDLLTTSQTECKWGARGEGTCPGFHPKS